MSARNFTNLDEPRNAKESFYSFEVMGQKLEELRKVQRSITPKNHPRFYSIKACLSYTKPHYDPKADVDTLSPLQLEYIQKMAKSKTSMAIDIERLEEARKDLEKRNSTITGLNHKLVSDCGRVQSELKRLIEENAYLKSEKSMLMENNARYLERCKDLEAKNEQLEKQLRTLDNIISDNTEKDEYISSIRKLEKENIELIEVLERLDKELERFKADNIELRSSSNKLEETLTVLRKRNNSIKHVIDQFNADRFNGMVSVIRETDGDMETYEQKLIQLKDAYNILVCRNSRSTEDSNQLSEKIRIQAALLEKQSLDIDKLNREVYHQTNQRDITNTRLNELFEETRTVQLKYQLFYDINKRYKGLLESSLKELTKFDKQIFMIQQPDSILSKLDLDETTYIKAKIDELNKQTNSPGSFDLILVNRPDNDLYNTYSVDRDPISISFDRSITSVATYISKSMQELYKKIVEFEFYKKEVRVNDDMLEKFKNELSNVTTPSHRVSNNDDTHKPLEVENANWKLLAESLLAFVNRGEVFASFNDIQAQISQSMKSLSRLYSDRKLNDTAIEKTRSNFLTHIDSRELDILLEKRNDIKKLIKDEKFSYLKASKKFTDVLNGLKRDMSVGNMLAIGSGDPMRDINDKLLRDLKSKKVKDIEFKVSFYEHTGDNDLRSVLD